ncbi:MAG: AMP-binding protein [Methylotenera sp.]|nr:AMP-binding protein [Oligoflexia bacterium]
MISRAWKSESLLILCPPGLKDFSFLQLFHDHSVEMVGSWDIESLELIARAQTEKVARALQEFPENPVLGVFTSGTVSGEPRLILYSKANIEAALAGVRSFFEVTRIKTIFCYPQPFHTFGLILGYVQAMLFDLELVALPGRYSRPAHDLRASLTTANLLTLGTPTHFHDLLEYARIEKRTLQPSYTSVSGGAKTSVSLWKSMRDELKIESPSIGYGASEAAPAMTHLPPGRMPTEDGEVGFAIPGVSLEIQPEKGVEFTGPNVCLAVIQGGKIEFPEKILIRDELTQRESDRVLIYKGRHELLLNRGGAKFSLEKIQEILSTSFNCEIACVAITDTRLGEELGVLFKFSSDHKMDRRKISEVLKENFGSTFAPQYFVQIPEMPLNPNGKVSRHECERIVREHSLEQWAASGGRFTYPLPVERLSHWLPHRSPAIWIDQINSISADPTTLEGECSVRFDPAANYASDGKLRQSSALEWIAQAYGYVSTCTLLSQATSGLKKPEKAYLVAITNAEWSEAASAASLKPGAELRIRVRRTHQMGHLSLIEGSVLTDTGQLLAKAQIKLFAE